MDSTIEVRDNLEIEETGTYYINLHPRVAIPADCVVEILFPPQLPVSDPCLSSLGACDCLTSSEARITGILSSPHTDTDLFIGFSMQIANPSLAYDYSEIEIDVTIRSGDLLTIYQKGILDISNTNHYDPHELEDMTIVGSEQTATNATFRFTFTNAGYAIPADSIITIELPSGMQRLSSVTPISNTQNLTTNSLITFAGSDIITIYIDHGFDVSLAPGQIIQFDLSNILTPYQLGTTSTFRITIKSPSIFTNTNKLFYTSITPLTIDINTITPFPIFLISSQTRRTGDLSCNYNFELELGDGKLLTSHSIIIDIPDAVQGCDCSTLASSSSELVIANGGNPTTSTCSFDIGSNIDPHTTIQFYMFCTNPYTTRPILPFHIHALGGGSKFYTKEAILLPMDEISTFIAFTVAPKYLSPLSANEYTIFIETHHIGDIPSTLFNQLIITVPITMPIDSCAILDIDHAPTEFTCIISGQDLTISGWGLSSSSFSFILCGLRNPPSSTDPIEFTCLTQHAESDSPTYYGENQTSASIYTLCNFPCKTCLNGQPNECLSCEPSGSSSFAYFPPMDNLYLLRVDGNQCLDSCPSHTFISDIRCLTCHSSCLECDTVLDNCTQCYPHTNHFLYQNECITPPCPEGFSANELDWECTSNISRLLIL